MSGDYKYVDVPLSPSLFGRLALELFPGRMMRRADLAIAVNQHHISNGGAKGTQPIDRIAKRALSSLAKVGAAENVEGGYGMWRLTGTPTSQHEPAPTHATPAPVPPPGPAGKSDNAGNGKRIPHDHDSPAESDLDPTETDYAYGGIPLTPSLAGRLAMQLFGGQVIRRNAIIEAVMDYHLSRGGQPPTMEPADAIRTGLSDLARNGLVESVDGAYGMWRFPDQGESIRIAYEQHTTEP